ncbi:immunogenic protein P37 [Borreliella americana]|uniref:immunogenic protein P37 n=1 Tax=Borreliella americana TaxID=478807 RepID=UPI001E2CAF63|nr:immunogenic protein P37 [Borreliella americana]MCD2382656.1 immunogenic protein P37 [Borreliella americana]
MNLMIKKVLMISSLFCSVISCKLCEKLTDKTKQTLANKSFVNDNKDINNNNNKSINHANKLDNSFLDSVEDNNRRNHTPRSVDDSKESREKDNSLGIQSDDSVGTNHSNVNKIANKKHDNDRRPQQVNRESSEAREAREIIKEVKSFTEECTRVSKELENIKANLDNIKNLANTARAYLEQARTSRSNKDNQKLLHSLLQAIDKVNSRYASLNICYEDAIGSLKIANTAFINTNSKAEEALKEASKERNNMGYNGHYYNFINDAKDAMIRAKGSLKNVKNKQECIKNNMEQTNAEFLGLKKVYEAALQDSES